MQTTHGCGDLIFSSHTTFALVGVLTYTEYGAVVITKVNGLLHICASISAASRLMMHSLLSSYTLVVRADNEALL